MDNIHPNSVPQNAMSVYGQSDAMDDFPVLKAFQQYVDAEQAKAQKRMTTLCVFFALILTLVVGVFVVFLMTMSEEKNLLHEKMLKFVMENRQHQEAAPAPSPQPVVVQSDPAVKTLADTVTALQKQLADQRLKMIEEKEKAADEALKRAQAAAAAAAARPVLPPSQDQLEMAKKLKSDQEKIAKATALLKQKKAEMDKEKERLRQLEIELQRRRLYPDYYRRQEAAKAAAAEEDDEEDDEDVDAPDEIKEAKPAPKPVQKKPEVAVQPAKPVAKSDGSLRYFEDDDEPANEEPPSPPEVKSAKPVTTTPPDSPSKSEPPNKTILNGQGASAGWTIPLE